MWTRVELKARAKENLRRYYWAAFIVSLILSLAGGIFSLNFNMSGSDDTYGNYFETEYGDMDIRIPDRIGNISQLPGVGGTGMMKVGGFFYGLLFGVAVVIVILSLVMNVFILPVLTIGSNRFYMESRFLGRSAGVGRLFWGFSHHYLNLVLTMFLTELFIMLGTLCCVFPGIYLGYCYRMVPYILSENPEMKPLDAMRLSKQMMDGHKLDTWILELSFIGWILLGMLACCVGLFFVEPYYQATYAELYAVLRNPFGGRLNGFGVPEPVYGNGGYYQNPYSTGSGSWDQNGSGYGQNSNWNQSGGSYGQNGDWNQNGGGYGQNGDWNQNGGGYGQNGDWNQNGGSYGQNGDWNQNGGSYGQNNGWNQAGNGIGYTAESQYHTDSNTRKHSGKGSGEGYYLNGEFHPYTDDEKE